MNQADVAALTGYTQQNISNYMTGKTIPDPDVINRIEAACGRRFGWVYIQSGHVLLPTSTLEMLEVDPALDDHARRALRFSYNGFVRGE